MKRMIKLLGMLVLLLVTFGVSEAEAYRECPMGAEGSACCYDGGSEDVWCCDSNGRQACLTGCESVGATGCSGGGDDGGGGDTGLNWDCTYIPFWGFVCTPYN